METSPLNKFMEESSVKKSFVLLLSVILCMTLFTGMAFAQTEDVIEYDIDVISENITEAYAGATDQGEYIGLGVNEDGSFALMFVFTPEEHITFVGEAETEETFVSIEDVINGLTISFEVIEVSEDGMIIDLGDFGMGTLATITVEELVDALVAVLENTFTVDSVE